MLIYATRRFDRFAKKERIEPTELKAAVDRALRGAVDAELGGSLIKQRVAKSGRGRSGGYRTIIALRLDDFAIFLYGFAKNKRANITASELFALKQTANDFLALSEADRRELVALGSLVEIKTHAE
jgi:hypothetical protein